MTKETDFFFFLFKQTISCLWANWTKSNVGKKRTTLSFTDTPCHWERQGLGRWWAFSVPRADLCKENMRASNSARQPSFWQWSQGARRVVVGKVVAVTAQFGQWAMDTGSSSSSSRSSNSKSSPSQWVGSAGAAGLVSRHCCYYWNGSWSIKHPNGGRASLPLTF